MKKRASILLALTAMITGVICYPINAVLAESTGTSTLPIEASASRLEYGVLTPGNNYTKTITITNNSEEETAFSLSIANYQNAELNSRHTQITEWLTFTGGTEFTLAAEASTNVNIRIRVPKDAAAGGQYASLIASDSAENSIILAAISAVISGTDLKYGGEVSATEVNWFSLSPTITSSATVKNAGNVDFEAKYRFTAKSLFGGDPIHEAETTQFVMPSATAELSHTWENAPPIGLYNVIQTITYVNANAETVEHTTERVIIICPIWLLILIGIIIIAAIVLIVILKNRRKKSHHKKHKKPSWEESES